MDAVVLSASAAATVVEVRAAGSGVAGVGAAGVILSAAAAIEHLAPGKNPPNEPGSLVGWSSHVVSSAV